MMDDQNKSAITKTITAAAIIYLDERGCKPIETEVPVGPGWVADIASVVSPTATELIALKLLKRAPDWSAREARAEWEVLSQQSQKLMTVLVEVKASPGDFRRDPKWSAPTAPTNLMYLAIPDELKSAASSMPSQWGILVLSGVKLTLARPPVPQHVPVEQQLGVIMQIANRRDNNTRYARLRELRRREVEEKARRRSSTSTINVIQAITAIVRGNGESLEAVLDRYDIKDVPAYYMLELQKLWGIAGEFK